MTDKAFRIKTMTRSELDLAIAWAAQEGWSPGFHDADSYYKADPNGFLMGYLGDEPIACISVIKYDDSFGFLGFYIVKPTYRGQGYGMQMWQAGLRYLDACNIGLDGVVEQQENYKKSGFELAYGNIRFAGNTSDFAHANKALTSAETIDLVPLAEIPFPTLDAYDRAFFPAIRSEFTQQWITQKDSHALGVLHDGVLSGYGVIRPTQDGYKIAPLFAETPELAERLFLHLIALVKDDAAIFIDVPNVNKAGMELVKRFDMTPCFETARMYTGNAPELPLSKTFGVTSFEIG
ncbi:N-acetyltransferase [Pseudidiomarina sediminum]|uniref:N-acetyltransferase n=2 Tax=Pseudidiomarina sediminum TaxID=431675 RepID=A0A432Z2R5_9GAMM|nr:N-acetyltransferase [Pseudidiomarina sediminum]